MNIYVLYNPSSLDSVAGKYAAWRYLKDRSDVCYSEALPDDAVLDKETTLIYVMGNVPLPEGLEDKVQVLQVFNKACICTEAWWFFHKDGFIPKLFWHIERDVEGEGSSNFGGIKHLIRDRMDEMHALCTDKAPNRLDWLLGSAAILDSERVEAIRAQKRVLQLIQRLRDGHWTPTELSIIPMFDQADLVLNYLERDFQ